MCYETSWDATGQGKSGTHTRAHAHTHRAGPTNCNTTGRADRCFEMAWNATAQEKFWGFVTALCPLDDVRTGNDSRVMALKQDGYSYV